MSPQESPSLPVEFHTQRVGHPLLYAPEATSTMDLARQAAERGSGEGTVVVAGQQTAGRGRWGRTWLSPPGSLSLSVLFKPPLSLLPALGMIAPLAVVHTCLRLEVGEPGIKWPNDVLFSGEKVSGILVESSFKGNQLEYAIVGVGINVGDFPPDLPATSLSAQVGRPLSPWEVLSPLLEELDRLYIALLRGEPVFGEWRRRLLTLGQKVQVAGQGWKEEGIAQDVDREGSLLLRRDDGSLVRLVAGEVLSLRS